VEKLGVNRPDLTGVDDATRQYINVLEALFTNRQLGEAPERRAWTIERAMPYASLAVALCVWLFGAGGQFRDFQALSDRVKELESNTKLEAAKNEALYARRDLYDFCLKNMDDKLDVIGIDLKALKAGR